MEVVYLIPVITVLLLSQYYVAGRSIKDDLRSQSFPKSNENALSRQERNVTLANEAKNFPTAKETEKSYKYIWCNEACKLQKEIEAVFRELQIKRVNFTIPGY